jgi:hypothetical protein
MYTKAKGNNFLKENLHNTLNGHDGRPNGHDGRPNGHDARQSLQ